MSTSPDDNDFDLDLPTLPGDDLGAPELPIEVGETEPEELAINFVEDDVEPQLRGQNEAGFDDDGLPTEDLGSDDSHTQEEINRYRSRQVELKQQALLREEDLERRLVESEKQKIAVQRDSFKLALDSVDQRIDATTEALKYYRQEEDVGQATDAESQLRQLHSVREKIQANAQQLPDPDALEQQFVHHVQSRRQRFAQEQDQTVRPTNSLAEAWVKRNPWFNSNENAKQNVLKVDQDLVAEGFDPNTKDYFRELSRRVAKRNKGLQVTDLSGQGVGERPRDDQGRFKQAPVASSRTTTGGGRDPRQGRSRTKVDISAADRQMMRAVGIDPANKTEVAEYAKNKLERLRKESL